MTKIYIHACTRVHMKIDSTTMKVMSSEIASSIEIRNVISYFLGAGWRIWPSNYSFCFSKRNGCELGKYIDKINQAHNNVHKQNVMQSFPSPFCDSLSPQFGGRSKWWAVLRSLADDDCTIIYKSIHWEIYKWLLCCISYDCFKKVWESISSWIQNPICIEI